jgi:lipid A 4'-phosphatase
MLRRIELYFPIILMILIAPFSKWIDLEVSKQFYVDSTHEVSQSCLKWIYLWSPRFVMLLTAVGLIGLGWSFWSGRKKEWRKVVFYLVLVVLVGCGLVINITLKEVWGRPRPVQIEEFGGVKQFRPFYLPDLSPKGEPSKSFPSGHASGGFAFFSLYFLGRRYESKWLAIGGFLVTLLFGGLLGFSRIVQGGHYVTDILGSALVLWYTALVVDRILFGRRNNSRLTV